VVANGPEAPNFPSRAKVRGWGLMETNIAQLDIHTSDLTASCMKSVELRLNGKLYGETGEALFKGNLAHETLGLVHNGVGVDSAFAQALSTVQTRAKSEGYPLSQSVKDNMVDYTKEVRTIVDNYIRRVLPTMTGKLVAVEPDVRMTAHIAARDVSFASHLDLVWIDAEGTLHIWDWKLWSESPTHNYLHRNLQLALYWLMGRYGEILVDAELGIWKNFGGNVRVTWINLSDLRPYMKKTPGIDDNGEPREFVKGDDRPLRNVIRAVEHQEANEQLIWDELETRVLMRDAGLWPTNPDPVGCQVCQSKMFCPSFAWRNDETE